MAIVAMLGAVLLFAGVHAAGRTYEWKCQENCSFIGKPTEFYEISDNSTGTYIGQVDTESLDGLVVDTTNPYKNWYQGDPLNEWGIEEAYRGKKVLLALDEEALSRWGIDYAVRTVERADEALIYHFQIDLRIQNVINWESDDTIQWMNPDLYYDAWNKLASKFQDGYDIIIAVTGQGTTDEGCNGLAPPNAVIGQNTLILVRFSYYFKDDNVVQHEVAHCFGCDDHPEELEIQCAMAYNYDWVGFLIEDGQVYDMFQDIRKAVLVYDWCESCSAFMNGGSSGGGGSPWRDYLLLRD